MNGLKQTVEWGKRVVIEGQCFKIKFSKRQFLTLSIKKDKMVS